MAESTIPDERVLDVLRASAVFGRLDVRHRPRTVALSDHYLEPPVASFPLMGYGRAAQIAEVGYCYAMQEFATWTNSGREAR